MPKGVKAVAGLLLQVTPSLAPREASGVMRIWLLAVTAAVATVVLLPSAAMTKLPELA